MIKKILNRVVWVLLFVGVMVTLVWANLEHSSSPCTDLVINMKKTDYPVLISSETIRTNILEELPALIGQSTKNVEIEKLEKHIILNSKLSNVKAFMNLNGTLNLNVKPRKAIIRIFDNKGINQYLGEGGVLMETSSRHTQRIIVASGHIKHLSKEQKSKVLRKEMELPEIYTQLYTLAQIIHEDEFLESLIDQIYVTKNKELELTPKLGVKKIYLGKAINMEEKLANLKVFYIDGNKKIDWQKYKSISIKFRNQIVCSKK